MEKPKIIIVEDELIIAREIEQSLMNFGYSVPAITVSGEDALKKIEALRPDLVLMDIKLRGKMDGIEAAGQVHALFDVPVVYLTANADKETVERAKKAEPYGLIYKPVQLDVMRAVIEMALYKHGMEKQLKEREARLDATLQSIGDAVITTDTKGRITGMNPVAAKLTGRTFEEAEGKPLTEVFNIVNARTGKKPVNPIRKILENGEIGGLANHIMLMAKDGTEYQITDSASPIRDTAGNIIGVVLVFRDVADEYRIQEALRESEERFRGIFEHTNSGVAVYEAVDDGEDFVFRDFNPRGAEIECIRREDVLGRRVTEVFPGVEEFGILDVFRRVWGTGKPEHYPSTIYQDDRIKGWRENYVYRLRSGEVVAVYEDITDQKQAEVQFRAEKEFTDTALDAQLDTFFLFEPATGKALRWNRAFREISGYTDEEIAGMPAPASYYSPEDLERAGVFIQKVIEEGSGTMELELICKDGRKVPTEYRVAVINDDQGKPKYIISIGRDITERKRVEEALRESEEKYHLLVENAPSVLWKTSEKGITLFLSSNIEEIYGYTPEAIYADGHNLWLGRIHPDDLHEVEKSFQALFVKRKKFDVEYRIKRKDGEWIWLLDKSSVVSEENGERYAYGVFTDITERKQAEEQTQRDLKEKVVLLKEIHHRVKNNMNVITSLLSLQSTKIKNKEQAMAAFEESRNRIYSMALVHEQLYGSDDLSKIDMKPYIKTISLKLKQFYAIDKDIALELVVNNVFLDVNYAVPCGLILNELITNAYKHAFPGRKSGRIKIAFRQLKDKSYELTVQDYGVGLPEKVDIETSETLGLKLVNILTEQIEGKLEIERTKGTTFIIRFSVENG